jgi:uncharacterized protein with HEPN domain
VSEEDIRRRRRLEDIVKYAQAARDMVAPLSRSDFLNDLVVQKAACFDLLCVSEATARLLDLDPEIVARHPEVPWPQVRAIANVLRHQYGRIDMDIVWDTITMGDLHGLAAAVAEELERTYGDPKNDVPGRVPWPGRRSVTPRQPISARRIDPDDRG